MSQEDRRMRISLHLSENQNEVQKQIENCADILFRPLLIGEKEKTEAFLIYIEVAVSNLMLEDSVIGKLLNRLLSMDTKEIYGTLENNSLGISDTKELFTLEEAMAAMFAGNAVLFVDGYDRAIKIGSKGYPGSGVQKTDSEKGLRGSKEAFSESVKMNTALIRKRIRNAKMKAEEKQVGRYSATTTALLYLDGVVYLPICEEMRKRLDAFEVDGIEDGGMIEYLTRKKKEGRFPVYQTTERPDRAAQAILEGRVVLLTDNSPEALIFPATLNSLFQTADDYYRNERIVTFLRLIRYVAAFLALALPGLYVTVAALTALGSFSIPNEELSEVFRLWKYGILLLGSCFGILGVMLGCFLLLMLMAEQESYGIPWLYPYVGGNLNERADEKDSMFLAAARKRKRRPIFAKWGNRIRFRRKS